MVSDIDEGDGAGPEGVQPRHDGVHDVWHRNLPLPLSRLCILGGIDAQDQDMYGGLLAATRVGAACKSLNMRHPLPASMVLVWWA